MRFYLILYFLFLGISSFGQILPKHVISYGPEVCRSGEFTYAVTSDKEGILYFATDNGVLVYDGETWEIITIQNASVSALEFDTLRNRLWVGGLGNFGYLEKDIHTRFRYVCLSDSIKKTQAFKHVWQILCSRDKVTFMTSAAHFIVRDHQVTTRPLKETYIYEVDGVEYFSTIKGNLFIQEGETLKEIWNQSSITYEAIYHVLKLNNDNHLLVTPYDGVFIHHLPTHKIVRYKTPLNDLFINKPMYQLRQLNNDLLVVGTWRDGILITDLKGNLIDNITTEDGLFNNGVSDLSVDSFGKLWAATDYGISVIDLKTAWPNLRIHSEAKPKTFITALSVNQDSVRYWPESLSTLSYTRSPQNVRMYVATTGLEYMAAKPYKFRLDGYDTSWYVASDSRVQEYQKLPNGTYTFRVKSLNEVNSIPEATLTFKIREPWYIFLMDSIEYILIATAFIVALVFAFTYRLRASKKKLIALVAEKTRAIELHQQELIDINRNLMDANEELDTFLYRSSHDLISPVKSIKGLLTLMKMSVEERDTYIPLIEDRLNRLERILSEINEYVKNVKKEPVKSIFHIRELVVETWAELEFMPDARGITFEVLIDENLEIECDKGRWKMVISNLFANAVKYHNCTREHPFIRISVSREGLFLNVIVEDNGQGIKQEYQQRLFEMFYRANESSKGTGLGLFLVKKVVDSLKGTIKIDSTYLEGTRVEIRFLG
jgi:signal transduction histidine kinase